MLVLSYDLITLRWLALFQIICSMEFGLIELPGTDNVLQLHGPQIVHHIRIKLLQDLIIVSRISWISLFLHLSNLVILTFAHFVILILVILGERIKTLNRKRIKRRGLNDNIILISLIIFPYRFAYILLSLIHVFHGAFIFVVYAQL